MRDEGNKKTTKALIPAWAGEGRGRSSGVTPVAAPPKPTRKMDKMDEPPPPVVKAPKAASTPAWLSGVTVNAPEKQRRDLRTQGISPTTYDPEVVTPQVQTRDLRELDPNRQRTGTWWQDTITPLLQVPKPPVQQQRRDFRDMAEDANQPVTTTQLTKDQRERYPWWQTPPTGITPPTPMPRVGRVGPHQGITPPANAPMWFTPPNNARENATAPIKPAYDFMADYNNARESIKPAYDFMADYNRAVKNRDDVAYLNYIKRYPSPVNDGSRDEDSGGSSGGGFGTRYGGGGGWGGSSGYQNAWPIDMGLFQWNYRG